jgi:hypothetical protein
MGRRDEIRSMISLVPVTFVHSQSRHEYAGASGQTCRDMIPAKPPLIRKIETVRPARAECE